MAPLDWLRPPRQVAALFFLAAVASTTTLAWLTWQLLASDRVERTQRLVDDRDRAADAATRIGSSIIESVLPRPSK